VDGRWRRSRPDIYATAAAVHLWRVIYRCVPAASTLGRIATPVDALGIGGFIQGIEWTQRGEGTWIDQLHGTEVPAGIADRGLFQVAVTAGDLEALAIQSHGAVTTALLTLHGAPEGLAQGLSVRAVTPYLGGIEKTP